jgi:tRNA pseudouridine55 synthase
LLEADKTYEASVRLGVSTATGDREGAIVATAPVAVRRDEIEGVLARFVGEIEQVPPMFSAIKHAGRPLYKLARAGITVARNARRVRIRSLQMAGLRGDILQIRVVCGKGTYIRVLAEDIGRALGCGAHLDALRRTAVGKLTDREATRMEVLEADSPEERRRRLLSVDTPLQDLPRVELAADHSQRLLQGRAIPSEAEQDVGLVRLYESLSGRFLGIGMIGADGTITPRRLMASGTDIA